MPVIDHIDPVNRDIYLHADTVTSGVLDPMDVYKEMRTLRQLDESLRPFDVFLEAYGFVFKGFDYQGNEKYTPRGTKQLQGTRFIPYDVSHTITVIGEVITDDGQEGKDCFDLGPLSPSTMININYIPPQVEIIRVAVGSGLDATQNQALKDIWERLALDPASPMTVWDDGKHQSQSIRLEITVNPDGSKTVTRLP